MAATRNRRNQVPAKAPEQQHGPGVLTPTDATNENKEFARRLYQLLRAKNWNQSELARAAFGTLQDQRGYTVPRRRDSVSNYLQGKALPDMKSREALAKALGVRVDDLLPNVPNLNKDDLLLEILHVPNRPGLMRIRVDQLVPADDAIEILQILRKHKDNG